MTPNESNRGPAIGRRGLLLVVVILAAAGIATIVFWPDKKAKERPKIDESTYIPPPAVETKTPPMPFVDVSSEAGLTFRHETGGFLKDDGSDSRYLPECMGPGVVLADFDGDGRIDIFVPNGMAFPDRPAMVPPKTAALYRNEGGLKYRDIARESGLGAEAYGMGGAAADLDGDGDPDLLVTTWGGPRLYRNDLSEGHPRFVDVTAEAGLTSPGWTDKDGHSGPDWSTSAAFFDADSDGDLDLFIANYVRWTPKTDIFFSLDGRRKSFTNPERYHGSSCRFLTQEEALRFKDRTLESGVFKEQGKALGVAVFDFDRDGREDVVVANDTQPNYLFRNLGAGKFQEIGLEAGIAYDENANVRAGMGIDVADYLNDGVPGVPIGNFSNEPVALYRMESKLFFRDVTQSAGIAAVTLVFLTFGLLFADIDQDGLQDLLLANGHLEPHVQSVQAEIPYKQVPQLLHNQGGGRFVDARNSAGPAFSIPMVARGLASADLDQDGDLDLVLTENGGGIRLLRNDAPKRHGWLRVRLIGTGKNRDALGARILLRSALGTQERVVRTGSSYLSQSELTQTFGVGPDSKIDALEVIWPDGTKESVNPPPGISREVLIQKKS